jgi:hypothetical protein
MMLLLLSNCLTSEHTVCFGVVLTSGIQLRQWTLTIFKLRLQLRLGKMISHSHVTEPDLPHGVVALDPSILQALRMLFSTNILSSTYGLERRAIWRGMAAYGKAYAAA